MADIHFLSLDVFYISKKYLDPFINKNKLSVVKFNINIKWINICGFLLVLDLLYFKKDTFHNFYQVDMERLMVDRITKLLKMNRNEKDDNHEAINDIV